MNQSDKREKTKRHVETGQVWTRQGANYLYTGDVTTAKPPPPPVTPLPTSPPRMTLSSD